MYEQIMVNPGSFLDLISGKLSSGLVIRFEDHGILHGSISFESFHCSCSLRLFFDQDFYMNLTHILKVVLGEDNYMSAAYNSSALLSDILKKNTEVTGIFWKCYPCGFAKNGRFAVIGCDRILESKEELIEFFKSSEKKKNF